MHLLGSYQMLYGAAVLLLFARSLGAEGPTFYKNVLPVLQKHCQTCHRPGEVGPMPLLTYAQVKPFATAIARATAARQMPPWYADLSVGHFKNDRRLSDAEIRTIQDWFAGGATAGNPKDAPQPVHWIDGWTIGRPELVFEVPQAFNVPASGVIPYQYVIVPTHFKQDTWVRLAEVRAGDRAHAHHIVVSVREPDSDWLKDEPVGIPFSLGAGTRATGVPGEFLAGYGPGAVPEQLAPDEAKLIKAGSDLVF
jgi:hypothetical protein